jgi:hypothetical protein
VWLDVAREFTERWHHQQQIRDAVGRPGLLQPRFLGPVIDAFVRALPRTYRAVAAPVGTCVVLSVTGDAGGRWALRREPERWRLYVADPEGKVDAELTLDQDVAWRVFTKGYDRARAAAGAQVRGDRTLALKALETVSIIG